MFKYLVYFFEIVFFSCFLIACSVAKKKPLLIDFSEDKSSIIIRNIDPAGLLQLKNTSEKDSAFDHLISVLQTPSENDSLIKELPVEGIVKVTDSSIVFIPVEPFVKGRDYIVYSFLNSQFGDTEKMLKGKLNYNVIPNQKLLSR